MGGWVSGWVGGWVSRWVGGWVSRWVGRWVSEWLDEWVIRVSEAAFLARKWEFCMTIKKNGDEDYDEKRRVLWPRPSSSKSSSSPQPSSSPSSPLGSRKEETINNSPGITLATKRACSLAPAKQGWAKMDSSFFFLNKKFELIADKNVTPRWPGINGGGV